MRVTSQGTVVTGPYRVHVSRQALTEGGSKPIVVRSPNGQGGETVTHHEQVLFRCPHCATVAAATDRNLNASDGVLVWIACDAINDDILIAPPPTH